MRRRYVDGKPFESLWVAFGGAVVHEHWTGYGVVHRRIQMPAYATEIKLELAYAPPAHEESR